MDGTHRFYFVTLDASDMSIENPREGKYLIIDLGRSGIPEEAHVIATTDDQVYARELVQTLRAAHP